MKKIICLLILAVTLSSWTAKSVDYAIISGVISNKTENFKIVSKDQIFSRELKIDSRGSFKDTLRVKEGMYYILDGKSYAPIYITAGSNIIINADAKDFSKTIRFSGKGSEISTYLVDKREAKGKLLGEDPKAIYLLEEQGFKDKLKEIKQIAESTLSSSKGLSDTFAKKEIRNINYEYLGDLAKYERLHAYYLKKSDFKASAGFLTELEGLSYNNAEDYNFSDDYKQLIAAHYMKIASDISKEQSVPADIALLKSFSTISDETVKNGFLFDFAKSGITFTTDLSSYYKIFMEACTNAEFKEIITKSYNELLKVGKGRPSPKFENYENYAGGTSSLEDFKGKYVYIDIWATWCAPCKAEIPFLEKTEKKYHGKNISFISISVDRAGSHDAWKKMVEKQNMNGIQLFADKDFDSKFIKDYMILAIPRFILIDPNGNIVDAHAPKPSEEEKLTALFTKMGI